MNKKYKYIKNKGCEHFEKIPSRTCIGCGTQKSKTELIRIVKTQSGEIKLDKTGKLPGRGAYICDKSECLNLAIRSKKLEKTFETKIEESVYESLKNTINQGV